jgi:hypothetical protein
MREFLSDKLQATSYKQKLQAILVFSVLHLGWSR